MEATELSGSAKKRTIAEVTFEDDNPSIYAISSMISVFEDIKSVGRLI